MMLARVGMAYVYANFGRWVAECGCSGATEFGTPNNPPVLASAWQCVECGDVNETVWPNPEMMYGIERLLLMRRYRKHQNWVPGETLADLHRENALHGVYDDLKTMDWDPGLSLLTVQGEELITDMLPTLNPRRELKAIG